MSEHIDQAAALQAEAEEWVAVPSEVDSRALLPLLSRALCHMPTAIVARHSISHLCLSCLPGHVSPRPRSCYLCCSTCSWCLLSIDYYQKAGPRNTTKLRSGRFSTLQSVSSGSDAGEVHQAANAPIDQCCKTEADTAETTSCKTEAAPASVPFSDSGSEPGQLPIMHMSSHERVPEISALHADQDEMPPYNEMPEPEWSQTECFMNVCALSLPW